MENNQENLEQLVLKLREQGIGAGEEEKQRIIAEAKQEAKALVEKAKQEAEGLSDEASKKIGQMEENARASLAQASRDVVESTRAAILELLKTTFSMQGEKLFTGEQYLGELLKAVVAAIPGDKQVSVPAEMSKQMEAFLLKEATGEKLTLKPLGESGAKILVESSEKGGMQFVLSSEDVQEALFSLLNSELIERITGKGEEA